MTRAAIRAMETRTSIPTTLNLRQDMALFRMGAPDRMVARTYRIFLIFYIPYMRKRTNPTSIRPPEIKLILSPWAL